MQSWSHKQTELNIHHLESIGKDLYSPQIPTPSLSSSLSLHSDICLHMYSHTSYKPWLNTDCSNRIQVLNTFVENILVEALIIVFRGTLPPKRDRAFKKRAGRIWKKKWAPTTDFSQLINQSDYSPKFFNSWIILKNPVFTMTHARYIC